MDDQIGKRLIGLRKALNDINQGKFAQKLGIKQAVISNIEIGQNGPSNSTIKLICLTFGINEEWLRNGEGPMFKDGKVPEEDTLLEIFRSLSPEGRKMVLDYAKLILKNEKAMWGEQEGGEKGEHPIHSKERG
ncbi:MAG: helix-turn-helix domain-containing protein [Treponema sp.]|jgi:transcriptional regulator with XRE-family HTH domain|nr:helix-turn-helix domain-containing protein [Treponema sp.]